MGRLYVPSTPASRGEVEGDEDVTGSVIPEGLSHEEALEAIGAIAAELGYELVPIVPTPEKPEDEPAGNASTDEWLAYAKTKGAQDSDLVDGDGKALTRDALREKYGTPQPA